MNGMQSTSYEIVRAVAHSDFLEGRISLDVGLIRIKGRLPNAVVLAPTEELAQIAPGMPVFLYGFPGRLNNVAVPEATFVTGEIGRVTGLDQSPHTFAENILIQHSAFTSAGTSGSPLFNAFGHVIGINTGGYTENGQALTGYNFGLRIDAVYSLMPGI
jgi:S1-C subfamily serine protease